MTTHRADPVPSESTQTVRPPSAFRVEWRTVIGGIAVVLVVSVLLFANSWRPAKPAEAPTAIVELGDIEETVQATGIVQPKLKVDVGAQITGQVRKVHVKLGDWVKVNQLLISLDPEAARTAVQQAQAQLAQQAASLRRAEVDLDANRREADRQRRLLTADATSAAEQEQAATALARAESDVLGQQAALAQREADLADRRLQLGRAAVLAPVEGQVVNLAVQEGQSVNAVMASPTLLTLAQLRTVIVKTRVPEADIGRIQPGQIARFTTMAVGGQSYEGRVQTVQPIPERVGSNALFYNVLFEVGNADGKLLSDMTVKVNITVAFAKRVPLLPIIALSQGDAHGGYSVQVLQSDGRVRTQAVRVGLSDAGRAELLEGLKPGDRVLLYGAATGSASAPSAGRASHGL